MRERKETIYANVSGEKRKKERVLLSLSRDKGEMDAAAAAFSAWAFVVEQPMRSQPEELGMTHAEERRRITYEKKSSLCAETNFFFSFKNCALWGWHDFWRQKGALGMCKHKLDLRLGYLNILIRREATLFKESRQYFNLCNPVFWKTMLVIPGLYKKWIEPSKEHTTSVSFTPKGAYWLFPRN